MSILLVEMTYKELRSKTEPRVKERSLPLITTYESVTKSGTVTLKTTSGTTPGKFWYQKVKLADLQKILKERKDITLLEKVRLALQGDVKILCNDPSFGYWGWAYIATENNAKFGRPERRFPKIRNPKLRGSVCKHLENALLTLPFHAGKITKDLKGYGFK